MREMPNNKHAFRHTVRLAHILEAPRVKSSDVEHRPMDRGNDVSVGRLCVAESNVLDTINSNVNKDNILV